jgi:WD40 repeat protein
VNLHDPVRVPDNIVAGSATFTLSFDAWKGVAVAPTTHSLTVSPSTQAPEPEHIAPNLIASLPLKPPRGGRWKLAFSPDGTQLFASCYPFGIVQIWDLSTRKEVHRIAPPSGYGGSGDYACDDYALITPDWKTLYVAVSKRIAGRIDRDGKKFFRVQYTGFIRVWDLATGREKDPLRPTEGAAPSYARLDPSGQFLVCVEQHSFETLENMKAVTEATVVWDLASRKKWKLCDGSLIPGFAPDGSGGLSFGREGKTVLAAVNEYKSKTSMIKVLYLATGKQLAQLNGSEKGRYFSVGPVSPDGTLVAVSLGGTEEQPQEVAFLDARSLEKRGKLSIGKSDPEHYGLADGQFGLFAPDGKRFVALGEGSVRVWNVTARNVESTTPIGQWWTRRLAISPDGKFLAVAWMPGDRKLQSDLESGLKVDQKEFPQPRVSLIDLAGNAPPRVLVAPHGHICGLAFSPDGKTLALEGGSAVHLFDLRK